jgi:hypothetical protein
MKVAYPPVHIIVQDGLIVFYHHKIIVQDGLIDVKIREMLPLNSIGNHCADGKM